MNPNDKANKKQKREPMMMEEQQYQDDDVPICLFEALPDALVARTVSLAAGGTTIPPVLSLTRGVCKKWCRILNETQEGDKIFWKAMCLAYFPVLEPIQKAAATVTSSDDDNRRLPLSWQELFHHRFRHLQALLRPPPQRQMAANDEEEQRHFWDV